MNSLDQKRTQPASHLGCYNDLIEEGKIAVCDLDKQKLTKTKEAFGISVEHRFHNYHNMMQLFKPEIVSISTPTPTHKAIACAVASYPCVKAILLEKPMAQSLEEADAIIETCKENEVELTVNYTRRWSQTYHLAKHIYIGDIHSIIGIYPGPLLRSGSHMLDLFNWMIDDTPVIVQSFGEPFDNYLTEKTDSNDYNISGIITYKSGIQAILISGKPRPYLLFELHVFGTKGRIIVRDNGLFLHMFKAHSSNRYANIDELSPVSSHSNLDQENLLFVAIKNMLKRLKIKSSEKKLTAKKIARMLGYPNVCSGEDAQKTLKVALALHYSAMHDHRIVLLKNVPQDYKVVSY